MESCRSCAGARSDDLARDVRRHEQNVSVCAAAPRSGPQNPVGFTPREGSIPSSGTKSLNKSDDRAAYAGAESALADAAVPGIVPTAPSVQRGEAACERLILRQRLRYCVGHVGID